MCVGKRKKKEKRKMMETDNKNIKFYDNVRVNDRDYVVLLYAENHKLIFKNEFSIIFEKYIKYIYIIEYISFFE